MRTRLAVAVVVGCMIVAAACSTSDGSSKPKTTSTASTEPTTTTIAPGGALAVSPASGPPGTSFTLTLTSAPPGSIVTFHITYPNAKTYTGPPHTVGVDGKVATTFKPDAANPPGAYQVAVNNNQVPAVAGTFTVVAPGEATSSSGAGASSVVASSTTTRP